MLIKERISGETAKSENAESLKKWMDLMAAEGFDEFMLYPENDKEKAIVDYMAADIVGLICKR